MLSQTMSTRLDYMAFWSKWHSGLSRSKCVTLAPTSISHFTSSGGKQFCNDVNIIIDKVQFKFSSVQMNLLTYNYLK